MPPIDRILLENITIRRMTAEMREIADRDTPPSEPILREARWRSLRTLLRMFILKNQLLFAPLAEHADLRVVARTKRHAAETAAVYTAYEARAADWPPDIAQRDWPMYRAALRELVDTVDERLTIEETELLPHLATAPTECGFHALSEIDWVTAEVKLRARLGLAPLPAA